jgi:hypothetical protein
MSVIICYDETPVDENRSRRIAVNWTRLKRGAAAFGVAVLFNILFAPAITPRYHLVSFLADVVPFACVVYSLALSTCVVVSGAWFQKPMGAVMMGLVAVGIYGTAQFFSSQYYGRWYVKILGL